MKASKTQKPYTSPYNAPPKKIKGRKTGAVKALIDVVRTPLDKIDAPSAYPVQRRRG